MRKARPISDLIGEVFPDNDPKWKDAASLRFLEQVRVLLAERNLRIAHIDAIVIAERPKLGPHFPAMRQAHKTSAYRMP